MQGLMSYRHFGRARSLRSDRTLVRARSLRSDRAEHAFGRCVTILLELLSDDSCFFRKGGIAGCSSADFAFANTSLQRTWRNPAIQPSTSGNKSLSLASSDSEAEIDEVQSQQWYGDYSSAHGSYYTTFPPDDDDDDVGASAPTHFP
ncbi:hypothetical protein F2Q69_00035072 [Brassica cretica]|uniref:Uncharacterized protein n=1 Tax=Brassica cretica TaxID=69181 RepID=A0A8S9SJ00_BRACR|nr:hypothetical protein F2Q69_00035072 [Brassica cretica]